MSITSSRAIVIGSFSHGFESIHYFTHLLFGNGTYNSICLFRQSTHLALSQFFNEITFPNLNFYLCTLCEIMTKSAVTLSYLKLFLILKGRKVRSSLQESSRSSEIASWQHPPSDCYNKNLEWLVM